jgi:hypothetical protein
VVDLKRRDPHAVSLVYDTFLHFSDAEGAPVTRGAVVLDSNGNVELVRLSKVRHHVGGAGRSPHLKRHVAAWRNQPSRQPQIGKADHVIGVQVSEKHAVNGLPRDVELHETLQRAAPGVE